MLAYGAPNEHPRPPRVEPLGGIGELVGENVRVPPKYE
jgi:hypothetical protein